MEETKLIVSEDQLALVENNSLNTKQLQLLVKKTPEKYIRERPGKGGGKWKYVTGGYVKKVLNLMFGWDWDFQVLDQIIQHDEVIVKGRLTCRVNDRTIIKEQFGNKDIAYKKDTKDPLSIGNDMKAAATDCLKKCASEIGIAADIYNPQEFREIEIEKPKLSTQGYEDLMKRIETDSEALKEAFTHFQFTEKQAEKLMELNEKYHG